MTQTVGYISALSALLFLLYIVSLHCDAASLGNCPKVCTRPECVYASDFILSKLDHRVSPCDDFYDFACGKWMEQFGEEDDFSIIFDDMRNAHDVKVKRMLDQVDGPPGTAANKLKVLYDSCMSHGASELNAVPSVLTLLKDIGLWEDGGWTSSRLPEAISSLIALREFAFFDFEIDATIRMEEHFENTNELGALNITVRPIRFVHPFNFSIMEEVVLEALQHLGVEETAANQTYQEILRFHCVFMQLYKDYEGNGRTKVFFDCAEDELNNSMRLLCNVLDHLMESLDMHRIYSTRRVHIYNLQYTSAVQMVLSMPGAAPYLGLRMLLRHAEKLDLFFWRLVRRHPEIFPPNPEFPFVDARWQQCVRWADRLMSAAMVPRYPVYQPALTQIDALISELGSEAESLFWTQDWLDEGAKVNLTKAVKSIRNFVSDYIGQFSNDTFLDLYYKKYRPTQDSFFLNAMEIQRHRFRSFMTDFMEESGMLYFNMFFEVQAYFFNNHIGVSFGFMQPPFYWRDGIRQLNLGNLGFVIGHEIGHGIGDSLDDETVVDNDTLQQFREKSNCLAKQFGLFHSEGVGHEKTEGTFFEDLADTIGVQLIQKAMQKLISQGEVLHLPGLQNFTLDQVYRIFYAQTWCTVKSRKTTLRMMEDDSHSLPKFRINGVVQNTKEFSESFGCPIGSPMNPSHKCTFLT